MVALPGQIVDPTAPELLGEVASCEGPRWPREILHRDGYLYVTSLDEGLTVLDVTTPGA